MKQKHLTMIGIIIILVIGILVRMYHLTYPIADWHSFRQVDTASVARNFVKWGIDPLRPRYDDLSNIQSGKDNPMGWRMVEMPLYQTTAVIVKRIVPMLSIEIALRLVSITASVGSAILLMLIVSSSTNALSGIISGLLFAILPYSFFYGRATLPEPFMVFFSLLSLYVLELGLVKKEKINLWFILVAGISAGLALLVKPYAVFLLIPAVYLFLRYVSFHTYWFIGLILYWSIGLLPLVWWRHWILQFPDGIPVFTWLFNEGNIRFKGAWFYWLFAQRIGNLILGYWGLIPLGIGLIIKPLAREGWYYRWWLTGGIIYISVLAGGNVRHDYYQYLLLPVLCIYAGKGFAYLLSNSVFSKGMAYILTLVCLFMMVSFSWYTIRTYYWINRPEIVIAGQTADKLIPKDAKVIASYNGDTTFLYQTNRQGWPLGFDIPDKIKMGATHYVTVSPTDNDGETKDLAERFTVLVRNDKFAIIDLTKPRINK